MQKFLFVTLSILMINGLSYGQVYNNLSQTPPFDKEFRTGVLPNGLTYYIRHNQVPKERASYYLFQNVGGILEEDNQNGLAHFLEHMAFNGTVTFPGNSLMDFLERQGVKFGKDANAYTATNETVYNVSNVPTINEKVVDSCLHILRDWCNELSLDVNEINAERGVIQEEWRTRIGMNTRIGKQIDPVKYNYSLYSKRDVMGDMEIVRTFDPKVLRDFYHDWYRTDLQAIAIVGDIDVDAVEKRVKALFSAIPAVENPKERILITIPDNEEPLYTSASDKELRDINISLSIRSQVTPENTIGDMRERFVNGFFNRLIGNRIKEKLSKGKAFYLSGTIGYYNFVKGYNEFKISARTKEINAGRAFESLYDELQRVINFGFTQGELNQLKVSTLASAENNYNKRERTSSDAYAKLAKKSYLEGNSITDAEFNYNFAKAIIPTITLEEVSAYASKFLTNNNRVFIVYGPEGKESKFPTLKALETSIKASQEKQLEPYVYTAVEETDLLSEEPVGGEIVSEKRLDTFDAVEWTLSNGAKVIYRFADYQKDLVSLSAESYGGSSVYDIKDIPSYRAAAEYVKRLGLGKFDTDSYNKFMTGKNAQSSYNLGSLSESVTGKSSTKDVETMMQLVYMRFTEPRFDENEFNKIIHRVSQSLEREVVTPDAVMKDTINNILNNGNPRDLKFDKTYIQQMDFRRVKEIYTDRFSDASDFTFFIVGDVSEDVIKPLVEKYIGSLEDIDRNETWLSHGNYYPTGKHYYKIGLPTTEPKSTVMIKLRSEDKYSRENVIYNSIIGSILNLRYTESIREKEGGTYGVGVKAESSRMPNDQKMYKTLSISFVCDPEKADYLKTLVYKELDKIQEKVRQDDLDKVVLNLKKNTDHRDESNGFWLTALQKYYDTGEDMTSKAYLEDILNNVSVKDIKKAVKKFMSNVDVVDIIFYPETQS